MARAARGASNVRTIPANTTALVPIKKDFANFIDFLLLHAALRAGLDLLGSRGRFSA
jgi:hypothetical protein